MKPLETGYHEYPMFYRITGANSRNYLHQKLSYKSQVMREKKSRYIASNLTPTEEIDPDNLSHKANASN